MKTLFKIIYFIAFVFIVNACDEISLDKIEHKSAVIPKRKVLVEYFTGHDCINCPGRSKPAFHELELLYGDNVVVLAIHAGWFAEPFLKPDNLDLTSPVGNEIFAAAGVTGVPIGRVDRKLYNKSYLLDPAIWSTAATSYIAQEAPVVIDIKLQPLASDSVLKFQASILFTSPIDKQLNAECYLTQDSIIGNQTAPTPILEYVFMDVLRTDIKSKDGTNVLNTNPVVSTGTIIKKDYELSFKSKVWKQNHCHIVIVITDAASGECIQTEKVKVIG